MHTESEPWSLALAHYKTAFGGDAERDLLSQRKWIWGVEQKIWRERILPLILYVRARAEYKFVRSGLKDSRE